MKTILVASLTAFVLCAFPIAAAFAQNLPASKSKASQKAAPSSAGLANALKNVQKQASTIYYAANDQDWATAENQFNALQKSAADAEKAAKSEPGSGHLESCMYRLEAELTRMDRLPAMLTANEITGVAASLLKPTQPKAPADVAKLNYLGRELLADADGYELSQALFVSKQMKESWQKAQPEVKAHGGQSQATALDNALQQVQSANDIAEYQKAAQAELKAAAKIAGLFGETEITKAPSSPKSNKSKTLSELDNGPHLNQPPVDGAVEPLNNDRNKIGP